jgi:hypothetical protein
MRYDFLNYPDDFDDENSDTITPLTEDDIRNLANSIGIKYSKRDKRGYVYLLEVLNTPGLFKIGKAKDLDDRRKTFNVKLPFPIEYNHTIPSSDCYALETLLHRLFKDQRQGGEFFLLTPADVLFIKSLSGD